MHTGVPTSDRPTPVRSPGVLDRISRWFADVFDSSLTCDTCGYRAKRRMFTPTGVSHEYSIGSGWFRTTTNETEFLCPNCNETVSEQRIGSYYPIF